MGPEDLAAIIAKLDVKQAAELIVGIETADDAGVYRLSLELALVQTLDFITPIVDDPYLFGRIAAVNSLSDVYAMGGRPLTALNICCFPAKGIPPEHLARILEGGFAAIREAGAVLAGGHTIKDNELKYGLSVTGCVHPDRVLRNAGARPGDALVLTKPVGAGIWATAAKHGVAPAAGWEAARAGMRRLNAKAADAVRAAAPHAVTDVTGFGLLGHLHELLAASSCDAELWAEAVPVIAGTRRLVELGEVPGGTRANLEHAAAFTTFGPEIHGDVRAILADAQTSGGLLAAVPADAVQAFHAAWIG